MFKIFYDLAGINHIAFIVINNYTNVSILPYILQTISKVFFIGNFAIFYILICIYFYYRMRVSDFYRNNFYKIFFNLFKIGSCYGFFGLIYAFLKFNINMPRPFCSLNSNEFITVINTSHERCLSSFPSAHTGLSIIIFYFLWPFLNQIQKIFSSILVIAVIISRITLAMHHPADIVYSIILVLLIIKLNDIICNKLKDPIIMPIGKRIEKIIF